MPVLVTTTKRFFMKKNDFKESDRNSSKGEIKLTDGAQTGDVRKISTTAQEYDVGRLNINSAGSKGNTPQSWNNNY